MSPQTDREAWLAERRTGIGGSDCASLFNVGYGCRRRLWYDKTGATPDYPREESDLMALGKLLEPFFADKYAERTERGLSTSRSMQHHTHPEIRVNADRLINAEDRPGIGVLEIKAMGRAMFYKTVREGMPDDYSLQLQHGMLVAGTSWGSFAIGCRDSGELMHWDVERKPEITDMILQEAPKFWKSLNGEPPPALEPDDKRCQSCEYRKSCQGASLVQLDQSGDMPQAEELRPLLVRYAELQAQYCHQLTDGSKGTALDMAMEDVKEELKAALGDRQAVMVGTQKVYFRPGKPRELWDTKGLVEAYRRMAKALAEAVITPQLARSDFHAVALEFQKKYPPADSFRDEGKAARPLRIYL